MFGWATLTNTTVTSTCAFQAVMAGAAGTDGKTVANCFGQVGVTPTPTFAQRVGMPLFIQIDGVTEPSADPDPHHPTFTITPKGSAVVHNWSITPIRAGKITVKQSGLPCTNPTNEPSLPKTCTMMIINAS